MKNPIKTNTNSSFRAAAMPMAMALLAIFVARFPVAAEPQAGMAPEQQQRLELMKSKAPDASLTILPVRLAGKPWDRVTEVVGVLLEQQGLKFGKSGRRRWCLCEDQSDYHRLRALRRIQRRS